MKLPKNYTKTVFQTREIDMLECPRCGAINTIDAKKCGYCGCVFIHDGD